MVTIQDSLTGKFYRFTVATTDADEGDALGSATLVSCQSGIYYVDGFFVLTDAQTIPAYQLDSTDGFRVYSSPTTSIGFILAKNIVTSSDDGSLLDPSFGSPNQNAPGADRLQYVLTLSQRPLPNTLNLATSATLSQKGFFEIVRI